MTEYKVGDKLQVLVNTYDIVGDPANNRVRRCDVLDIVEFLPEEDAGYWISPRGVEIGTLEGLTQEEFNGDFMLVVGEEDTKEVITPCTRNPETGNLTFGDLYKDTITPQEVDGGIARPILSERKVGKVPVHMVIEGFPRALREVSKVLGWAADAKQYKLHDWKNLPDADVEFPSAGYRHMFDNSEMKADGIPAIERVDHESRKLHLAHEIFNKLAELELVLTGVIK